MVTVIFFVHYYDGNGDDGSGYCEAYDSFDGDGFGRGDALFTLQKF
jgi:hypothetical protein